MLCSPAAASFKWMLSSEPNGAKERAISKSQFHYTATCLTLLNILRSVGSGTVRSDLEQSSRIQHDGVADAPSPDFVRLTERTRSPCVLPFLRVWFPGEADWLGGPGVDNYCFMTGLNQEDRRSQTLTTALPLINPVYKIPLYLLFNLSGVGTLCSFYFQVSAHFLNLKQCL